jgi:hypothetical protein
VPRAPAAGTGQCREMRLMAPDAGAPSKCQCPAGSAGSGRPGPSFRRCQCPWSRPPTGMPWAHGAPRPARLALDSEPEAAHEPARDLRARRGPQAPAEPQRSTMRGGHPRRFPVFKVQVRRFGPGCSGCESKMAQAGTQTAWDSEVAFGKVKSESRVPVHERAGRGSRFSERAPQADGPGPAQVDAVCTAA